PYIDMTIKMIEQFGGTVTKEGQTYHVSHSGPYLPLDYLIEPDVSGASYFFAMAVLTGGSVLVKDVHLESLQGDIRFLDILERLGAKIEDTDAGVKLQGPVNGCYNGIDIDLNDCSDQTMTLAALAVFAETPTIIRNIGHIRLQESDRIHAIVTELKKLGITCEETNDSITIYPGMPQPAEIDTYNDHRMAMAFSLIGLRAEGIVINDPDCTSKTFENYFELLDDVINSTI
ncbi:MAG: 3-phosphoshikimate 1-carboxyvinyltransferase, partial [Lachnospiraceae bacterium]|nr:3-phosphoshikimate 1-carboxyvinyltransferase [Lachnospiraceae bacterium]